MPCGLIRRALASLCGDIYLGVLASVLSFGMLFVWKQSRSSVFTLTTFLVESLAHPRRKEIKVFHGTRPFLQQNRLSTEEAIIFRSACRSPQPRPILLAGTGGHYGGPNSRYLGSSIISETYKRFASYISFALLRCDTGISTNQVDNVR